MVSKETQKMYLREMFNTGGWKVLEIFINEQIQLLRNSLENDPECDVLATQRELKAYKAILRKVEEARENKDAQEIRT